MEINVNGNKIEILEFWWPFWKCREVNVSLMPLIKIQIVYHMLIYSVTRLKLLYSSPASSFKIVSDYDIITLYIIPRSLQTKIYNVAKISQALAD